MREQVVVDADGKRRVVVVAADVLKRQYRDRAVDVVVERWPRGERHDQRDDQHADDGKVDLAAEAGGRCAAVLAQPARAELVDPGEHDRDREADNQRRQNELRYRGGQLENLAERVDDLEDQPGGYDVGGAHAEDVAAPEFREKRHQQT